MSSRNHEMKLWWELSKPIRMQLDLSLETIDEFIIDMKKIFTNNLKEENTSLKSCIPYFYDMSVSDLVDQVFESAFNRRIQPIFDSNKRNITCDILPDQKRLKRGFICCIKRHPKV